MDTNGQRITELTRHVLAERFEPGSDLEPGLLAPLEAALEAVKADMHATGLPGPIRLVIPEWSDPPRAFVEYRGGWGSTSGMLRGRRQAGLGTGERSAELTSLLAADRCAAPYPGRYVVCTRALALVEALTGLGVRHSWELLLDLARNWVIAVPLIDTQGNIGSHTWRPKPIDHGTSSAGQAVPDAEAHRIAPVPAGLINGSMWRGGLQPPLAPFRVVAALHHLLDHPDAPDEDVLALAGPPLSLIIESLPPARR